MTTKKTFPKKKAAVNTGVLEAEKPTEISVENITPVEDKIDIPPMPKKSNFSFGPKKNKPTVFELTDFSVDPRTKQKKYALVYMIKAEDIIYDPIKGVNRKIRYIPGEASIFEEEQKKESKVKSPIIFSEGFLIVGLQNPTLKKFLMHHNQNADNPNRMTNTRVAFKLKDEQKKARVSIKKSVAELDAMTLALKMPIEKLVGYAKVLGVNVDKSTDEIRYDMKIKAQKSPEAFLRGLDNPITEIKETIIAAKEYKIIDIKTNKVCWILGSERPLIAHVPIGKEAVDYFADFCKAGEGEKVLKEIKRQIQKYNS
tara:strand:+ start:595 stop:1533 length:939 start_codon:yes stop_codon:yes gene_type:complete